MKLNTKLFVNYTIIGIVLLLIVGYYTGYSLRQDKFRSIQTMFITQLYQFDVALSEFLQGVEYDVRLLAADERVRTRDDAEFTTFVDADEATFVYHIGAREQQIIDLFSNYRSSHPYTNSVYMGRENGSLVRSHKRNRPTRYDPRLRPWYELGKANPERVVRTAPYRSVTTSDINIGTVKALLDGQGQVYGVVGIDVTLYDLTSYISHTSVGESGHIVLLDDRGIVLSNRDQDTLFQKYDEVGLDDLSPVMANDAGYTTWGANYVFYYTSPLLGWKLCAVVPRQEIDRPVRQFTIKMVAAWIVSLLLLSVLIAARVQKLVVKPITVLHQHAERIAQTGRFDHIVVKTNDEIGRLAVSFNDMVDSVKAKEAELREYHEHLEDQVIERTAELVATNKQFQQEIAERAKIEDAFRDSEKVLKRRNTQLEAAVQVAKIAITILDPHELMQKAVDLIRKQFNFYYVGLFLIDDLELEAGRRFAVLRAGTGQAGKKMLQAGHRLLVGGESMVGWSTAHAQARIALDVEVEAMRFNNPDLPDTRSEMALPLMTRNWVIGALSVQSTECGAFSDRDIAVLQAMADHLATAITNARLYKEAQREIGERKRAEQERKRLISELENKNTELERFTYTVSHDLKSPLITIKGFLGFLDQDAITGNVARVRQDIERISGAADKMQYLLNDLLKLSRIGRLMSSPEWVSLVDLAQEAVEMVSGRLVSQGVQVQIDPDLPQVYGDRSRLLQVMQNLIDNASKYMGGQPHPKIEVGMRNDYDPRLERHAPVFFVRDNGIGIEPGQQGRVFDLFTKLDQTTDGTGIGLSIVRRIIEVHDGRVWVESEGRGQGSTFCFTLNLSPQTSQHLFDGDG